MLGNWSSKVAVGIKLLFTFIAATHSEYNEYVRLVRAAFLPQTLSNMDLKTGEEHGPCKGCRLQDFPPAWFLICVLSATLF